MPAVGPLHHGPEGQANTTADARVISLESNSSQNQDNRSREDLNPQDLEFLQEATTNTPPWSVFTSKQKRFIVFMVAMAGFFSPLSANIYFPALTTLAEEFSVSNSVINLTLTSYMIFQGLAPTIFGDLADMAGRRPAYIVGFAIYLGANIGLALCNSYAALLVLRCLQATGSSSTIALASGVVADIATSAERGLWMGWATSGPMVAAAVAPVLGGIFARFLGWRWIFWFLVILSAAFLVPFLITVPETGRNVVGNGSIPPQGWNMSLLSYLSSRKARKSPSPLGRTLSRESNRTAQAKLASKRKLRFPNPLNTLHVIAEKDVALLLFYNSIVYTAFYALMGSFPTMLEETYNYDSLQIGLSFLPFGIGCFLAPICMGKLMDLNFRRIARKIGYEIVKGKANDLRTFPIERCRIGVALPCLAIGDAALLCYGWVMDVRTHLAVPLVLHFIIGLALTGGYNAMNVLLVDLYPLSPSTATAANNLIRCLMGAGGTGIIIYMIEAMGRGWCFTFISAVVAALSPILFVLQRWGPEWREARRARAEEKSMRDEKVEVEVGIEKGVPGGVGSDASHDRPREKVEEGNR